MEPDPRQGTVGGGIRRPFSPGVPSETRRGCAFPVSSLHEVQAFKCQNRINSRASVPAIKFGHRGAPQIQCTQELNRTMRIQ